MNIVYEIGDGEGIMSFSTIIPGHKCRLDWYMWDKEVWGKEFARECQSLVRYIMATFNLHRVWSNTAKKEIAKYVMSFGAKIEGIKRLDFQWGGKLYNNYCLALETSKEA